MMVESQMIAFFVLTGLMGHALFLITRGDGGAIGQPADEPSHFWSSERFNQSGDGYERPFFLE